MNKKNKKVSSLILALVLILSNIMSFGIISFAEEAEAVAYISFATEDWVAQYWNDGNDYAPVETSKVVVDGYGQYTVTTNLGGLEAKGLAFLDVEIANGEALFPNSYMQIDSILINGEAVELANKTYTTSDDEIITRTNLFNEWVEEITSGRTLTGGLDGANAVPIDKTAFTDTIIETIEVTFTLKEGLPLGTSLAYLSVSDTTWSNAYWFDGNDYAPIVANNVEVTGYGQYSVSLDFGDKPLADLVFMDVEIKNGEINYPYNYMQIDEMKINGEAVELGNTYTNSDNKQDTRTNLYNTWVSSVDEGRTNGLEFSEVTAAPLDGAAFTDVKTIEVTFTMIEGEEPEPEAYVLPESFNAFMMFSDISGAWENYGPGTSGDTQVTGDGTYTVFLNASDIGATGQATEGQVFLIDIENLGEAMYQVGTLKEDPDNDDALTVTDLEVTLKVWVDGNLVESNDAKIIKGDIEGNKRLRLELYNIWGTGTADNPVVDPLLLNPADEIKVEFTLSGTGIKDGQIMDESSVEEATEEVAEETDDAVEETTVTEEDTLAVETEEETETPEESNNGLVITIVILVVLALGAGFYFTKKKK